MLTSTEKWKKRYKREKDARLQAEKLLEEKSSRLYLSNVLLKEKLQLEEKIQLDSSKLRRQEKKFTALFHSSIDGIILHTPDGIILEANQTICNLLRVPSSDLIGTPVIELHELEYWSHYKQSLNQLSRIGYLRCKGPGNPIGIISLRW